MESRSPEQVTTPNRHTRSVYTVIERENGRSFWVRVGAAWNNRDGSITLRLEALPINGMLQIRDDDRKEMRNAP